MRSARFCRWAARARRPALLLLMAACLVVAAAGLWAWMGPETVRTVRTTHLAALLGLLLVPPAAIASLAFDSSRRRRESTPARQERAALRPAPPPTIGLRAEALSASAPSVEPDDSVVACDIASPRRRPSRVSVSGPPRASSR